MIYFYYKWECTVKVKDDDEDEEEEEEQIVTLNLIAAPQMRKVSLQSWCLWFPRRFPGRISPTWSDAHVTAPPAQHKINNSNEEQREQHETTTYWMALRKAGLEPEMPESRARAIGSKSQPRLSLATWEEWNLTRLTSASRWEEWGGVWEKRWARSEIQARKRKMARRKGMECGRWRNHVTTEGRICCDVVVWGFM